ncbi:hypothetical protein [Aquimarina sp. AU58]|uniref:hypothetical protein n=1 Tax=Aquimarina sp. AU58 TaxID=1874112 RepID=UPI000D6DF374|nr:hypothetical protein [Aquimarina sp. AU58]
MPVQKKKPERNKIPKDQWNLVIRIDENGNEITLEDYDSNQKERILPFQADSISEVAKKELALNRLENVKNYGIFRLPDVGKVDREKAIQLIKEDSEHAKYLIQLELKTIDLMVQRLNSEE